MSSEDRAVEEDDGLGVWVRGAAEVEDVAVGTQAADDGGPGWSLHRLAMGSDRDLAICPLGEKKRFILRCGKRQSCHKERFPA